MGRQPLQASLMPIGIAFGLTLLFLWPCFQLPYHALPAQAGSSITVPLFNAWTIGWNAHSLANGLRGYWHAPIFAPDASAFAYSEPQPILWLVSPVVWLTGSVTFAYRFYLGITFFLNALFMTRVLRRCGLSLIAQSAGACFLLGNELWWANINTIQLLPIWGCLWCWDCILKQAYGRRSRGDRFSILLCLEFAFALTSVFLCSVHHGLFWCTLLPITFVGWFIFFPRRRLCFLKEWAVILGLAILFLLPLIVPMYSALRKFKTSRNDRTVLSLSANWEAWRQTPGARIHEFRSESELENDSTMGLFSRGLRPNGWLLMLSLLAACRPAMNVRRFRVATILLITAIAAWGLSWGPNLELCGVNLWNSLVTIMPPLEKVRSVYRYAYFVHLPIVCLAAMGVDSFTHLTASLSRKRIPRSLVGWLFVFTWLLSQLLFRPTVMLAAAPDLRVKPGWVEILSTTSQTRKPIVHLPFVTGYGEADFEQTTKFMLHGLQHLRPMLNGYSGFFPPTWYEDVKTLSGSRLTPEQFAALRKQGVALLVVDRQRFEPLEASEAALAGLSVNRIYSSDQQIEIWELAAE
ncbi:MAG: hypothetical protein KDB03_22340 [Planctomycetales bacterium]|nr:hypothetical protein [Planctomycetales bacterium]